jgi:hypothetical protein
MEGFANEHNHEQRRRLSGKTPLGKAFQYALSRWEALTRYVDDGRLSIDNNLSERLLRGVAVSRKNFMRPQCWRYSLIPRWWRIFAGMAAANA